MHSPQSVLLHAGLVGGRRGSVLVFGVEQSLGRISAPIARPPPSDVQQVAVVGTQTEALLRRARRRYPPCGSAYRHQNDSNSCGYARRHFLARPINSSNWKAEKTLPFGFKVSRIYCPRFRPTLATISVLKSASCHSI